MAVEFELKYSCAAESLQLLRTDLPGQERQYAMSTTYYDTPTGDLSAKFYTLRRRQENDISVCTLKIPAADGARGEFEVECGTIEDAVPMLCKLSGIDLPTEKLVPVCGAKFTRIAKTFDWNGAVIELALDEGILTGGGREQPLCEVEVELKAGTPQFCDFFAKTLATRFGLTQLKTSKFRRALALYRGE